MASPGGAAAPSPFVPRLHGGWSQHRSHLRLEDKKPVNDVACFLHKWSTGGVTARVFPAALDILEVRQKPILMT